MSQFLKQQWWVILIIAFTLGAPICTLIYLGAWDDLQRSLLTLAIIAIVGGALITSGQSEQRRFEKERQRAFKKHTED